MQAHPVTSLLVVPVKVNGQEVKAVIQTGSTFTLMQDKLWNQLKSEAPCYYLHPSKVHHG